MAAAFQGSLFDDDLEPASPPAPVRAAGVEVAAVVPEPAAEPESAIEASPVGAEPAAVGVQTSGEGPAAGTEVAAEPEGRAVPEAPEIRTSTPEYEFADEIPLPDEPPPPDTLNFAAEGMERAARPARTSASVVPAVSIAPAVPTTPVTPVAAVSPALLPAPVPATPEEKAARLAEVRAQSLTCPRCDLARTRTNVVFGEGNPNAPLVFVGEGPGENEDATGRPFVGRAGKLLDEVLRRNGMTRDHVYICNVIKCRAADPVAGRLQNRPPTPEEISACQPWLEEQMRTIKPLVIVCVGGPSANTIIHKGFRITSERGKWFDNTGYAPWAMAVFHPAYILRLDGPSYGAALETLVEDIGKARQKVIEVKRQLKEAAQAAPPPRSLFD